MRSIFTVVRRALFVSLVVLAAFSIKIAAQPAPTQGPMFGTWKLNVVKSNFGGLPKPQAMLVMVSSDTAELIAFTVNVTAENGMSFSYSYKGALDGKPYAIQGSQSTYSYTRENGVTTETQKDPDGTTTVGTFTVAPNGKQGIWNYVVTDAEGKAVQQKLIYDRVK